MILIHPFIVTFANLIIPVWFFFGNLIAEIYGYKVARNSLIIVILLQIIIIILGFYDQDFIFIFIDNLSSATKIATEIHRTTFAQLIAICSSGIISSYIIRHLRSVLHGKHFILRGIAVSAIGEFIFLIVYNLIAFVNVIPNNLILKILISSYMLNLITNFLLVVILNIVVALISTIKSNNVYKDVEFDTIFNIIAKVHSINKHNL